MSVEQQLLGGRYMLGDILHEGQATVYRGIDTRSGDPVAVKIYHGREASVSLDWREAAILRRLQLPGVIRLLDEGYVDGRSYLVTPWVEGEPFPGAAGTDASAFVALVTTLAETLTRIHATGVVHGDLKPTNVLVDSQGNPKILDFGLADQHSRVVQLSGEPSHGLTGSVAYMSPGQLREQPSTTACDCYALGVMCFEVLAGHPPHPTESLRDLMRARLTSPAPKLRAQLDGVPSEIVASVEGLLSATPSQRREHLNRLRGSADTSAMETLEQWWAVRPFVGELLERLDAGESVKLSVEHGSREHFSRVVGRALQAAGREFILLEGADLPFESVPPALRAPDDDNPSLEVVVTRTRSCLEAALADGQMLVDAGDIDPWTHRILEELEGAGQVVRLTAGKSEDAVVVVPPSIDELEELFDGPERLFNTRSRAADLLWQRSSGRPDAILAVLAQWRRRGVGYWREGRFIVDPQALARIRQDPPPRTQVLRRLQRRLSEPLRETLRWIQLGASLATAENLARWRGERRWRVDAQVDDLVSQGLVEQESNGVLRAMRDGFDGREQPSRIQQMHRTIAQGLAPGHPERFHHVLRGDTVEAIVEEGCAGSRRYDRAGQVEPAIGVLRQSLEAAHRSKRDELLGEPLAEWAKIVLATAEPTRLEDWLHHAERCAHDAVAVRSLVRLVELARLACRVNDPALIAEFDRLSPFDDCELELRRHMYRARLASCQSCERLAEVLGDIEPWVEQVDRPNITGTYAGWMGNLRFRQDAFADAAVLHARAASHKRRPTARLASIIAEATAHMEALDSPRSLEIARNHLDQARRLGHLHYQARLGHLVRANRYRLAQVHQVDREWIEAVERLGLPRLAGAILLTEAAIAWRGDESVCAATLARQAQQHLRTARHHWPTRLAASLAWHCQPGAQHEGLTLADELRECPLDRLAVQGLALVGSRLDPCPDWLVEMVRECARKIPHADRRARLEVTCVDEAWELLGIEPS